MSIANPRYPIGCRINAKLKTQSGEPYTCGGHVVMIMSDSDNKLLYYCFMSPGAQDDFEYIHCVDLNIIVLSDETKVNTLQALNCYKEEQLEFGDKKTERKLKLEEIERKEILRK